MIGYLLEEGLTNALPELAVATLSRARRLLVLSADNDDRAARVVGALLTHRAEEESGEPAVAINQRSDACAVPRGSVVMEAMVALVLADAVLEKFGGDSVTETRRNAQSYLDSLRYR